MHRVPDRLFFVIHRRWLKPHILFLVLAVAGADQGSSGQGWRG